ncbi:hypothetical protein I4U23_022032 [Adineta vaga]|nr:hypothetical protein I4U23_022032 [Adineta vaga]
MSADLQKAKMIFSEDKKSNMSTSIAGGKRRLVAWLRFDCNVALFWHSTKCICEFITNTRTALMSRRLTPGTHSIQILFHNPPLKDIVRPSCNGLWMEFGVFRGATLTSIANWRRVFCGDNSQPVYGFDTFSGLPTNWRPGYGAGSFSIPNGSVVSVPSNVVLVKGLFIDTLPTQLRLIDREYQCHTPVSFVHIDCDIYDGARDVLFLLGSRLVSGSILPVRTCDLYHSAQALTSN